MNTTTTSTTTKSNNNEYEYFSVSVRKVRVIRRRKTISFPEKGEEGERDSIANKRKAGIGGNGDRNGNEDADADAAPAEITNDVVKDGSIGVDANDNRNGNENGNGKNRDNHENTNNNENGNGNSIPSPPQDRTTIIHGVQEDIFYPVRVTFCTPMFELKSYVIAVIPESEVVAVAVVAGTTMEGEKQKQNEDKEECGSGSLSSSSSSSSSSSYINAMKLALDIYGLPQDKIINNTVIIRGGSSSSGVGEGDSKKETTPTETTTTTSTLAAATTIIPQPEYCILDRLDKIVMNALRRLSNTSSTCTATTSGSSVNDLSRTIRDLLLRQRRDDRAEEDETRTSSVKNIYPSSLSLFPSIRAYEHLKRTAAITTTGTMMTTQILCTLAPFHDAIRTLSEDNYPTFGLTITVLRRIRDVLSQQQQQQQEYEQDVNHDHDQVTVGFIFAMKEQIELIQTFNDSIREEFLNAVNMKEDGTPPSMAWTMPLDPRLIAMSILSDREQNVSRLKLISEVQKIAVLIDQKEQRECEPEKASVPMNDAMGGIFWGEADCTTTTADDNNNSTGLPGGDATSSGNVNVHNCEYAKKNVESYFNTVQSQRRITDPLLWWKNNQDQFPELAILARKWIFCASSVYGRRKTRDNEYDDDVVVISSSSSATTTSSSRNNTSDSTTTTTTTMSQRIFLHDNIDLI